MLSPEAARAHNKISTKALSELAGLAARYSAVPIVAGVMQYFFSRKDIKQEFEDLKNSYSQALSMSPKLQGNTELAAARFQELAAVAPTVAKNPNMAVKFIEPRLKKGLNIDDVHKLTMIQSHAQGSPFSRSATDEASTRAGMAADRIFTILGPRFVQRFSDIQNNFSAASSKIKSKDELGGLLPQEQIKMSSQRLSDECVGEMLADRFVMLKQASLSKVSNGQGAGLASAAKKGAQAAGHGKGMASYLKNGIGSFGKGMAFFAAPMAMAGLVHGAGALIDAHRKKKLDDEANAAFAHVSKNSESIRGNPVLAAEALDAMKTFAPELAVKPNILKTFIEHTIKTDQMVPQTVNELATAQSNVNKAKGLGFAQGFLGAIDPALSIGKTFHGLDRGVDSPKPQLGWPTTLGEDIP